jgi:hypothetical protein
MSRIEYELIEVRLTDGTRVLGKDTKYGHCAKTFSNRTQAKKAAELHAGVVIQRGRPFYVAFQEIVDCQAHNYRVLAQTLPELLRASSLTVEG